MSPVSECCSAPNYRQLGDVGVKDLGFLGSRSHKFINSQTESTAQIHTELFIALPT